MCERGPDISAIGLLQTLAALMQTQQVAYDFEYCQLNQVADVPVTILSVGRSLLKDVGPVMVPLRPTEPLGDCWV